MYQPGLYNGFMVSCQICFMRMHVFSLVSLKIDSGRWLKSICLHVQKKRRQQQQKNLKWTFFSPLPNYVSISLLLCYIYTWSRSTIIGRNLYFTFLSWPLRNMLNILASKRLAYQFPLKQEVGGDKSAL